MSEFPDDIFSEPENVDPDTLANLGPLSGLAGTWEGLRYHTHVVKPGEAETYHDQVGYWLWEPATDTVLLVKGRSDPFHHADRNTLTRVGPAVPNPLARGR